MPNSFQSLRSFWQKSMFWRCFQTKRAHKVDHATEMQSMRKSKIYVGKKGIVELKVPCNPYPSLSPQPTPAAQLGSGVGAESMQVAQSAGTSRHAETTTHGAVNIEGPGRTEENSTGPPIISSSPQSSPQSFAVKADCHRAVEQRSGGSSVKQRSGVSSVEQRSGVSSEKQRSGVSSEKQGTGNSSEGQRTSISPAVGAWQQQEQARPHHSSHPTHSPPTPDQMVCQRQASEPVSSQTPLQTAAGGRVMEVACHTHSRRCNSGCDADRSESGLFFQSSTDEFSISREDHIKNICQSLTHPTENADEFTKDLLQLFDMYKCTAREVASIIVAKLGLRGAGICQGFDRQLPRMDPTFSSQIEELMRRIKKEFPKQVNFEKIQLCIQNVDESCKEFLGRLEDCVKKYSGLDSQSSLYTILLRSHFLANMTESMVTKLRSQLIAWEIADIQSILAHCHDIEEREKRAARTTAELFEQKFLAAKLAWFQRVGGTGSPTAPKSSRSAKRGALSFPWKCFSCYQYGHSAARCKNYVQRECTATLK